MKEIIKKINKRKLTGKEEERKKRITKGKISQKRVITVQVRKE